ncbi:MAG: UDP-N-acetylmuramoyl-L-alanyl-D-glutamate--2,6-diaminopimelate ligase [Candidatus Eisenbacteria bacterium]|uniref:UDP-N-acetylmuramoyl-L-alanyl-D-glutamate--2,6-diaminopimelate ligase n=1 Tax=Eiseniibacteriota bacterium TaxID=2212470 RepID=A0A933SDZ9_UNCEI|nr:UDP-N-acetylmuramoyl-L-alanyl-D-glutamate--2,6-diaminopimelate ligase [Candidatus Eisenbacteria bacterium]
MRLRDLIAALPGAAVRGPDGAALEAPVHSLALDSRKVAPGDVFFALAGVHADGARFVADAVGAGALAVVTARGAVVPDGVTHVEVDEPRLALAQASCALHGDPSRAMRVVAVTGTNGKTTTTYLLESIYAAAGWSAGVIGTTGIRIAGESRPSAFTTPESPQLQALLAEMRARGVAAVAMEASSHALVQRRTWGLACGAAIFTNLTQDHLDYHGTMDAYLDAKLMLFDGRNGGAADGATAVVNADDGACERVCEAARTGGMRVLRYGDARVADVRLVSVRAVRTGLELCLSLAGAERAFVLPMLGRFNAHNAAGAAGAALALGLAPDAIVRGLASFGGVPGRLERVTTDEPFAVAVDYAHTPDALERALAACREHASGRVLCVFGCGGDRDRGKRPQMGAIAARLADRAWVTNDNPRSERPEDIAAEIVAGAPQGALEVTLDRRAAIASAIRAAGPGDLVLVAGKGHESTQTIGGEVLPFDDRAVAREVLGAMR